MSMAAVASEVVELTERHLPVEPYVYGLVAFGVLVGLGVITWAFRSIGTRH